MTAKLKIVPAQSEPPIRIGTDFAAIKARDWASVHIRGDRAVPLDIPDLRRRVWR